MKDNLHHQLPIHPTDETPLERSRDGHAALPLDRNESATMLLPYLPENAGLTADNGHFFQRGASRGDRCSLKPETPATRKDSRLQKRIVLIY